MLEFTGSVMLLFVALGLVSGGLQNLAYGVWSGAGMWIPFFIGIGVIASMVLFFLSFADLNGSGSCGCGCGCECGCGQSRTAKKVTMAAGVSVTALTIGSPLLLFALLGFALAFVGTQVERLSCTCEMPAEKPVPKAKPRSRR